MPRQLKVFDIIGPRMIGPSSSHTAGAARLAYVARKISGGGLCYVRLTLYGSFAKTGRGHGTDKALLAGMLGIGPDDARLAEAYTIAERKGLDYEFVFDTQTDCPHPNTVKIETLNKHGGRSKITGASIGGGNIIITKINGIEVELTGEYPSMIVRHLDKPGTIAAVSGVLAEDNVNIAFMKVFRSKRGDEAVMVIETDSLPDKSVIEDIKALGNSVISVLQV